MSTPDPDSISWLAKLGGMMVAVVTPVLGARTWVDRRLDRKADKLDVAESFREVREDLDNHGKYIAKMFDQMRENEQRAQDRHERVMERLNKN